MKKQIFVGGSLQEAANRFAEAWNKAERGEEFEAEDNVTFASWTALSSVMTEKRYELLRHLHQQPAKSIRALSRDLKRDFKRVHEDVKLLESVGLIELDANGDLSAEYREIRASILLEPVAA
jgi:predicted transcriptional regulator